MSCRVYSLCTSRAVRPLVGPSRAMTNHADLASRTCESTTFTVMYLGTSKSERDTSWRQEKTSRTRCSASCLIGVLCPKQKCPDPFPSRPRRNIGWNHFFVWVNFSTTLINISVRPLLLLQVCCCLRTAMCLKFKKI
jgi:hypothetical protein